MVTIIVKCGAHERIVISSHGRVLTMLKAFLRECFDCNDVELNKLVYNTNGEGGFFVGDFICENFRGTFKTTKLITS